MKSPIRFLATAAILLAAATVTAQVYRWVDKDGKVQYSDQPPPAGASKADPKKIADAPAAATGSAAAGGSKSIADQSKDFDKRRKDAAKKSDEQSKKDEEARKVTENDQLNCKNARAALKDLESGRPIARTNESGDRSYLTDEQRQAEMARAKEIAADSCK
ncbi:MAG: DUF4124 domain-containing protein [Betaproteobacteria bacterium]|nr:DUF4124 domain-containing protein [Betaproteobacteria bacterium]